MLSFCSDHGCANQIKGKARGRHQWLYVGCLFFWACPMAQTATEWQPGWCCLGGAERGHLNGPVSEEMSPFPVTGHPFSPISEPSLVKMTQNQTRVKWASGGTGALKSPQGTDWVYGMPCPPTPYTLPCVTRLLIAFVSLSHWTSEKFQRKVSSTYLIHVLFW